MDFISLAQSSHAIVRFLTEERGGTAAAEDDDFTDLENIVHDHSRSSSSSFGTLSTDEQYQYHGMMTSPSSSTSPSSQFINTNRPLLSPTAEQELLSLSTNFLLYAAMVVIVTMVAKIYFPSCLEPREPAIGVGFGIGTSRVGRRADLIREEEEEEEDDDEEDEEDLGGRRMHGVVGSNGSAGRSDSVDEEEEGDEVSGLLSNRTTGASSAYPPSPAGRAGSRLFVREENNSSSSFPMEYFDGNKKKSRESVYTNLAICAIMLNLTFVSWGLLQVSCGVGYGCKSSFLSTPYKNLFSFLGISSILSPPRESCHRNGCSPAVILDLPENISPTRMHSSSRIDSGRSSCRVCYFSTLSHADRVLR